MKKKIHLKFFNEVDKNNSELSEEKESENSSNKSLDESLDEASEVLSDPFDKIRGGKFYTGYQEWGHVMNNNERSILSDLETYSLNDDIKNEANVIYNKMIYHVRRGKIRDQMLFYCVYCAHLELGRSINPIRLGRSFKLTRGEVQRCDSLFSPLQTGYRPPNTNMSPIGYLPEYCSNMNLNENSLIEVMKLSKEILDKDPKLYQENPQTVAAGLLKYFTITNGITTEDPLKMVTITGRSNVTIDGMYRRIATIDNDF